MRNNDYRFELWIGIMGICIATITILIQYKISVEPMKATISALQEDVGFLDSKLAEANHLLGILSDPKNIINTASLKFHDFDDIGHEIFLTDATGNVRFKIPKDPQEDVYLFPWVIVEYLLEYRIMADGEFVPPSKYELLVNLQ